MINHPKLVSFSSVGPRPPFFNAAKPATHHSQQHIKLLTALAMAPKMKLFSSRLAFSSLIAFTALIIGILPESQVKASSSSAYDNIPVTLSSDAQNVVGSINQIRANSGLSRLSVNPHLTQAAQAHVVDMITNRNHSHIGTDGSSVRIRIERAGYGPGNRSGENWVALTDPARAVEWWMNSPPHRANILNRGWQEIGIGSGVNPAIGLNYFVVVFASKGDGYTASIATTAVAPSQNNAPSPSPTRPEFHYVQQGETLSVIATKYGLSWQAIATTNNLREYSILSIGQALRLPFGSSVGGPKQNVTTQNVAYTVVTGDTLSTIANRFALTWQDLAFHNNLNEQSVLSVDQVLNIPVEVSELAAGTLDEIDAIASAIPATHVVQVGETIITIALQYELNWKELLRLNGFNDATLLAVGQTIRLK